MSSSKDNIKFAGKLDEGRFRLFGLQLIGSKSLYKPDLVVLRH